MIAVLMLDEQETALQVDPEVTIVSVSEVAVHPAAVVAIAVKADIGKAGRVVDPRVD